MQIVNHACLLCLKGTCVVRTGPFLKLTVIINEISIISAARARTPTNLLNKNMTQILYKNIYPDPDCCSRSSLFLHRLFL